MITHRVSELDDVGMTFGLSAGGQQCLVCGECTHDPAIVWSGNDGTRIYLHAECTAAFCAALLRDMREILAPTLDVPMFLQQYVWPSLFLTVGKKFGT